MTQILCLKNSPGEFLMLDDLIHVTPPAVTLQPQWPQTCLGFAFTQNLRHQGLEHRSHLKDLLITKSKSHFLTNNLCQCKSEIASLRPLWLQCHYWWCHMHYTIHNPWRLCWRQLWPPDSATCIFLSTCGQNRTGHK